MNPAYYLNKFQKTADQINAADLIKKPFEIKAGTWLDSVVIKLQKSSWANAKLDANPAGPSIFFSIWINDEALKANKIFYNVHALKLRKLNGYTITSREFAGAFRKKFSRFEHEWPNVSTAFGPQTLMQGWEKLNPDNLSEIIVTLVRKFLTIESIINDLLDEKKKR
jgi:hypothetical protein